MNEPIEVLYFYDKAPVVRYSDHCAKVQALTQELNNMIALAERLQSELTVARYTQSAQNQMIESVNKAVPRWDGKPKAL